MATAAPAKIKSALAAIKDAILDEEVAGSVNSASSDVDGGRSSEIVSLKACFVALLRVELLQRGAIVPATTTKTSSSNAAVAATDDEKQNLRNPSDVVVCSVLQTVQSNAGKSLLNESTSTAVPKPILAASAVLAGRISKKIAIRLRQFLNNNNSKPQQESSERHTSISLDQSVIILLEATTKGSDQDAIVKACLARCREVEDARFLTLLQLAIETSSASSTSSLPLSSSLSLSADLARWSNAWFSIAEGYFLRAAHFQPDAPPMWKKAWDCLSDRHAHAHDNTSALDSSIRREATTAVRNLHRIAVSKDNAKRAAELALILSDCYLQYVVTIHTSNASNITTAGSTEEAIMQPLLQAFVEPNRPIQPDLTPTDALERATTTFHLVKEEDATSTLSVDDQLYRLLLNVRLCRAKGDVAIATAGQDDYTRALNRASTDGRTAKATTTIKPPTLSACTIAARRRHLLSVDDMLSSSAVALRDCLIETRLTPGSNLVSKHDGAAWNVLREHVDWLLERAQVLATEKVNCLQGYWDCIGFITALFDAFGRRFGSAVTLTPTETLDALQDTLLSSSTKEEANCVEALCLVIPSVEWMLPGNQSLQGRSTGDFLFGMLKLFEKVRKDARAKEKADSQNVVGTESSREDAMLSKLDRCLAYVSAMRALASSSPGDNDAQWQVSNTATVRSPASAATDSSLDDGGAVGYAFVEFLVCWSGLHKTPWLFCTQPEARRLIRKARDNINDANSKWGRPLSSIERAILELGEADAEGSAFDVGLVDVARSKYQSVMQMAASFSDQVLRDIVVSHCYTGLADLAMRESNETRNDPDANVHFVSLARTGLEQLLAGNSDANDRMSLFLWTSANIIEYTLRFRIATSRQLVADAMLRCGNVQAAQSFLEDAARDAPLDASAAFALGRFRLYTFFFGTEERSPEIERAAQVQLLRAAKMDSTRAGPFALLGYWYEYKNDRQRAVGCYSKALLLDPTHPVAGRGVVRLAPSDSVELLIDKAITHASTVNGWAWQALGQRKALSEGRDDQAVVSLLKAIRCRDMERPEVEPLAVFFSNPKHPKLPNHDELSGTLSTLAACYRRLGRYTASVRSYHTAIQEARDTVSGSLLCACAQVELELGLFDDAVDKFEIVMNRNEQIWLSVAFYGYGVGLLAIAQRAAQDGKVCLAHRLANDALQRLESVVDQVNVCVLKLVGDLYSFGASLPARAFKEVGDAIDRSTVGEPSQLQVEFVAKGALRYESAHNLVSGETEDSNLLRASLLADVGSNLVSQAQLTLCWEGQGLRRPPSAKALKLLDDAASNFKRAIEVSPTCASAWCGLGCALVHTDALLAQHAFARAIELDKLAPDAYANLSFLYTSKQRFEASTFVSDALTEVADTPMMWINRALIMEQTAHLEDDQARSLHKLSQAADAYRASIQVMQHPSALLGLCLTCRGLSSTLASRVKESFNWASEYALNFGSYDLPHTLIEGALQMEVATLGEDSDHHNQMIRDGRQVIRDRIRAAKEVDDGNEAMDGIGFAFEQLVELDDTHSTFDNSSGVRSSEIAWSIHRQVVHSPNRGDLWMQLAKQLTSEAVVPDQTASSTSATILPALVAARRATTILQHQLDHPPRHAPTIRQVGATSSDTVRAQDLSDALALQYWLESILASHEAEASDTADAAATSRRRTMDLQRALLICPGNEMARHALRSTSDEQPIEAIA